ncbi:MAG TPA: phosphatase PAP2 family protein [Acidisoma sp.]|uniref:phosphatase PAP2 family protein n=1 Tax=Acidisoma sp. TaxID=1872115 RepID=UPI002CEEA12A|nr:phosphatase PAP2 family protein [Acidisoma sp.]HTI00194.1 phosphatase PAP2 family protein [Acidisoma sp.]
MPAILSCLLLVLFSYFFLDRPVAFLMHRLFHRSLFFVPLIGPAQLALSLAPPALAVATIAGGMGWRPDRRGWTGIICALAVTIAIAFKNELKYLFGRVWPETWTNKNPSLIHDGVYGFFPMHGGDGWASFPSGHTAAIGAVAGVLWWRAPELRWLWALLILMTAVGLLGGNYHFLADIIAGGYLGFGIGWAFQVLPFPGRERPTA